MRTINFTSTEINSYIKCPDDICFSSDNNISTAYLSPISGGSKYFVLYFSINGITYTEKYYVDSSHFVKIDLKEIFDLLFSKSEDSIFTTDISTFSFTLKIEDETTIYDSLTVLFNHIMLGKREVGDLIETRFSGGVYESGITDKFYFYLNASDHVWISQNSGLTWSDLGIFPQGINVINLASYTQTDLIFILGSLIGTFDDTFDDTFGDDLGDMVKYEKIECSDERTVRLRYLNRFGLWKYKHGVRLNKSYSVTGVTKLEYEKGDNYSYMSFDTDKKTGNGIAIVIEEQNLTGQNECKDLIESEFICMYVNGVWLPVESLTNSSTIDDKIEITDIVISLSLQNEG